MSTETVDLSKFTFAVDFDGTCVTHAFPETGLEIGATKVLKRMVAAGAKLILWTMRSDGRTAEFAKNGKPLTSKDPLTDAIKWFTERDIPLYGVQRNPTQDAWTSSPKAYANYYIDDAALGCPLTRSDISDRPYADWDAIELMIFGNSTLEAKDHIA